MNITDKFASFRLYALCDIKNKSRQTLKRVVCLLSLHMCLFLCACMHECRLSDATSFYQVSLHPHLLKTQSPSGFIHTHSHTQALCKGVNGYGFARAVD